MARPAVADWAVLELDEDPTPGDPEILKKLAKEYRTVSEEAGDAFTTFDRIKNQDLGKGKAMAALKKVLDELPNQVAALRDSYDMAADAIEAYAPKLRDQQDKAARALADGRRAKADLTTAIATASAAAATVTGLDNAAPPPPDDEDAKRSAREAMDRARDAQRSAATGVDSAQSALDAAKNLALEAKGVREADAKTAAVAMGDAEDKAVKKKNFWDKLWDTIGSAFGIISAVLGVISFLIPGLGALGLVLGAVSLIMGLVPLGINIARGAVTGDWDVAGIVLGVLGAAFGGFAVIKGIAAGWGGIGKGVIQNIKGVRGGPVKTPAPGAADDIPLVPRPPAEPPLPPSTPRPAPGEPPLPPSRPPSSSSSDDAFYTPPTSRPPTPDAPENIPLPGTRPSTPENTPMPPSGPPSTVPSPPPSVLPDNPGFIGQYLRDMKGNILSWPNVPGNIGASTAFGGTIYAPGATAGTWSGTVHAPPLVGNRNEDGT